MRKFLLRRTMLQAAWAAPLAALLAGCGTILHPERRGQPAGRIDWGIFALDALGLLLFFIPGVIAFAVDFSNGTIYLPACDCVENTPGRRHGKFIAIDVPREELTSARVEEVVAEHTRQAVSLTAGAYQTRELEQLDEYWPAREALAAG
ncbi:MAG: hypothetical protein AB7O62_07700 [Pirellulales bacterium]